MCSLVKGSRWATGSQGLCMLTGRRRSNPSVSSCQNGGMWLSFSVNSSLLKEGGVNEGAA
jgi:hypothetical protein